jgi:hypothetical protein
MSRGYTYKSEPPRHELLKLVVDEDALHVKLNGLRRLVEHIAVQLERDLCQREGRGEVGGEIEYKEGEGGI